MNNKKVGGSILPKNFRPSECLLGVETDVCSIGPELSKLQAFLKSRGITPEKQRAKVVSRVIKELRVENESDIYTNPEFRRFIGSQEADKILAVRFNPEGPHNSTKLLNNSNIDDKQRQWEDNSVGYFGKKYLYLPFHMRDLFSAPRNIYSNEEISKYKQFYTPKGDPLGEGCGNTIMSCLDVGKIVHAGYDCMGVVMNTDLYANGGLHWVCFYLDFTHAGTNADPYTIEYFNSSSRTLASGASGESNTGTWADSNLVEWSKWVERTKLQIQRVGKFAKLVYPVRHELQKSDTECGVWSLMYIESRLKGKKPSYFIDNNALDSDMIAFRSALFRHGGKNE